MHNKLTQPRIAFIDGLRGVAVLAVIIFHFGYLPNGYLGVDIFFVISGFLITGLIYEECKETQFSIRMFYLRRIRRIIPLVTFLSIIALIIGLLTMLPDDLENLAEQIVATNIFSNNILQAITIKDYWNVANDFKPLMHTWSLGIEEQYYIFYPFLFTFLSKRRIKFILPVLIIFTMLSCILYLLPFDSSKKFYYLPFRFFELSSGGVIAILLKEKIIVISQKNMLKDIILLTSIALLFFILIVDYNILYDSIKLFSVVTITCLIMILSNNNNKLLSWILGNKVIVFLGTISFGLYMWHQMILAYARYFMFPELTPLHLSIIFMITVMLSILTYHVIENPFRNKNIIKTNILFLILIPSILLSSVVSLVLYFNAGIVKDVPELNITKEHRIRNIHAKYNDRVYLYDKEFTTDSKIKVLVIGDSFARDFVNILLESKYSGKMEISYIFSYNDPKIWNRINAADMIFYSRMRLNNIDKSSVDMQKVWCIGTKNFGTNNGIFYNYTGDDYFEQRTKLKKGILEFNKELKDEWGDRYIDLLGYIIDSDNTVPVFTPDKKFISQDCFHLVEAGARYYARLLEDDKNFILNKIYK
jgi:peptidoglycan/LPS O-acetylase OafA/YrhL